MGLIHFSWQKGRTCAMFLAFSVVTVCVVKSMIKPTVYFMNTHNILFYTFYFRILTAI